MKEALINLIDVKTLVTLLLTIVFAILSLTDRISAENFMTIFCVIIAFYFGTVVGKKKKEADSKAETESNPYDELEKEEQ